MKLNKDAMKQVINYISEKQIFDLNEGKMSTMYLIDIVNDLSGNDENKRQEIACAIIRCINEGFIISNYQHPAVFATAVVIDVTLRGFSWLENK